MAEERALTKHPEPRLTASLLLAERKEALGGVDPHKEDECIVHYFRESAINYTRLKSAARCVAAAPDVWVRCAAVRASRAPPGDGELRQDELAINVWRCLSSADSRIILFNSLLFLRSIQQSFFPSTRDDKMKIPNAPGSPRGAVVVLFTALVMTSVKY